MRITGGRFGGRQLKAPRGRRVRPTRDAVRESLFGQLGQALTDVRVLDLYAGSGSLGLEALSRGAAHVTFVEREPSVARVLEKNLARLQVAEEAELVVADAAAFLARWRGAARWPYQLIFLDPPYGQGLAASTVNHVEEAGCAASGGLVVVEHEEGLTLPEEVGRLQRVRTRSYGSTRLTFYRRHGEGEE